MRITFLPLPKHKVLNLSVSEPSNAKYICQVYWSYEEHKMHTSIFVSNNKSFEHDSFTEAN